MRVPSQPLSLRLLDPCLLTTKLKVFFASEKMETDEDGGRGNLLDGMPPINCDSTLEGDIGSGANDIGDMTFCMGNFITDTMKVCIQTLTVYTYITGCNIETKIWREICFEESYRLF